MSTFSVSTDRAKQLVYLFGGDPSNDHDVMLVEFAGKMLMQELRNSLLSVPTKGYAVSSITGEACHVQLFLDRDRAVPAAAKCHGVIDELIARPR